MRPEPMVNVVKAPPRRKPLRRRRGGDAELTSRPGRPSLRHARRLGARRYEVKSAVLELAGGNQREDASTCEVARCPGWVVRGMCRGHSRIKSLASLRSYQVGRW